MSRKNQFHQPKALTQKQLDYIKGINTKELVLAIGPAGTGKSYLAAAMAASFYHSGKVNSIVLTRPLVPASKYNLGFLPGNLEEKLAPWVLPFVKVLEQYLGKGAVECMVKNGNLEVVPFDVIRGRTWHKSFVVLDEVQNCEFSELKAFLTRIGEGSTTVLDGDRTQSDLKNKSNGLDTFLDLLKLPRNKELLSHIGFFSPH